MKYKLFVLMSVILLSALFFGELVSAVSFTVSPTTFTFDDSSSKTLTLALLNQSETGSFSYSPINLTGEDGYSVQFSLSGNLTNINTSVLTLAPTSSIDFSNFNFGKVYSNTFKIYDSSNNSDSQTLTVKIDRSDFCEGVSNDGDLDVTGIDFDNLANFGEDDQWYPLSEIEVSVDVENSGSDDIDDVRVEWALYDKGGNLVMDGREDKFNLKDGDEETAVFTIVLDENIDELDDGTYTFYAKAEGTVDNDNRDKICESDSESVDVVVESNFVILSDLESPESVSCDSEFNLIGTAWNIGSEDQDEVSVVVRNKEMGIDKQFTVGDINALDGEDFSFMISMPKNATAKSYGFELSVYDEDNDLYESDSGDDSRFTVEVPVSGGNCVGGLSASVSGSVESGGTTGDELSVKLVVTNTGKSSSTFALGVTDYSSWADSLNIDKPSLTLDSGKSEEVLLTFKVKDDVSGDKSFSATVYSGSNLLVTQPFEVSIEGSNSWYDFGGLSNKFDEKWYLWVIGAINVLLIVIIIVVAVKVARK